MRDIQWEPVPEIAGMTPFACSYKKDGKPFAITLYGTSEEQILEDNCSELQDLKIDGVLIEREK